jgi:hypothetical protein
MFFDLDSSKQPKQIRIVIPSEKKNLALVND